MILTETMKINGKLFIKTFSSSGYMVERDGILYSEAIDPLDVKREYTESSTPVDPPEEDAFAEYGGGVT